MVVRPVLSWSVRRRRNRARRRSPLWHLLRLALRTGQAACLGWLVAAVVEVLTADPALADNCGTFSDCFGQTGSAAEAAFGLTLLAGLSLVLDFVPVVGDVKGVVEGVTGRDLLTGEELEPWERALGFIPFVPAADVARVAGKGADLADLAAGIGRHGDGAGDVVRHGDEALAGAGGARPPRDGGGGGARPPGDGAGRAADDVPPGRRSAIENEMGAERARRNLRGPAGDARSDVLARVDVGDRPQYGVNSRAADPNNNAWRREMFDEVRARTGRPANAAANQNQWPYHAEFEALANAWETSGRSLPAQVDMYVDKITCGNCRGGLQYAVEAFGVEELRIFQRGVDRPIIIRPLP